MVRVVVSSAPTADRWHGSPSGQGRTVPTGRASHPATGRPSRSAPPAGTRCEQRLRTVLSGSPVRGGRLPAPPGTGEPDHYCRSHSTWR
ncbi:hypothetical protein XF36_02570 [Pseudonocardia sp. HH130629-09]|nr:hypothetical protein XF36_02570 [Pseudonocardia sp. HH130629-09]